MPLPYVNYLIIYMVILAIFFLVLQIFLVLFSGTVSNQTCRQVFPANSILSYKYSSAEREKILEQILIRKQEHAVPIGAAVEGCFKNTHFC